MGKFKGSNFQAEPSKNGRRPQKGRSGNTTFAYRQNAYTTVTIS
jgi:hypothetical protein